MTVYQSQTIVCAQKLKTEEHYSLINSFEARDATSKLNVSTIQGDDFDMLIQLSLLGHPR